MGRVIAIASGKGGTGKSFFAGNLGAILAKRGAKVLLVDADTGAPTLDTYMDLQDEKNGDFMHVVQKEKSLEEVVLQDKQCSNLYLLPGCISGSNYEFDDGEVEAFYSEQKEQFDYVIVDCPTGSHWHVRSVASEADEVILVTVPDVGAIRNADLLITKLMRDGVQKISFVVNRINPRLVEDGDMLTDNDIVEIFQVPLLGKLLEDERVTISTNNAELYVRAFPNAEITAEMNKIGERIDKGLFSKFIVV